MAEKKLLPKRKSHAFGKDVYLFAEDSCGTKYWLKKPSWDCGWYWGFGYLEAYTRNGDPEHSVDIKSHTHVHGFFKWDIQYSFDKDCPVYMTGEIEGVSQKISFVENIFDNPTFAKFTFNREIGTKISELFASFYLLRRAGDCCSGGQVLPSGFIEKFQEPIDIKGLGNIINQEMIPRITAQIISYLTPEE